MRAVGRAKRAGALSGDGGFGGGYVRRVARACVCARVGFVASGVAYCRLKAKVVLSIHADPVERHLAHTRGGSVDVLVPLVRVGQHRRVQVFVGSRDGWRR